MSHGDHFSIDELQDEIYEALTRWLDAQNISNESQAESAFSEVDRLFGLLKKQAATPTVAKPSHIALQPLLRFITFGERYLDHPPKAIDVLQGEVMRIMLDSLTERIERRERFQRVPETAPRLPQDGVERIPLSEMTQRLFRTYRPNRQAAVRAAVDALLEEPDKRIPIDGGSKAAGELMGYYRIHGGPPHPVLYLESPLEPFLRRELGLADFRPDHKSHYLSENAILKNSSFFGYTRRRPYCREALHELIEELVPDPRIGYYRHEGAESYHVDPVLLDDELSSERILARSRVVEARQWSRESGEPRARPPEMAHWIPSSTVASQLGLPHMKASRDATAALLKQLYEDGNPQIGYFRLRGNGTGLYLDPDAVGTTVTKAMVEPLITQHKNPGTSRT